ncbi:MAG: hypothetical protein FWH38_04005 [Treponema sp.]|nr:hypothetical protein [Treponema sp.]
MVREKETSFIGPVENHRGREKGFIVYPVYSRRSGGLSLGINLFPEKKTCSFDCPYCEVFPFPAGPEFSAEQMERELRMAIAGAAENNIPVKDICFSGNGEPSLSPCFPEALEKAGAIRNKTAGGAELVLITNGTGLLNPGLFSLLRGAAKGGLSLAVWLKLDAGTPGWYKKMNRCEIPFDTLTAKIREFAACAEFTIQTMLCAVEGEAPPPEEARAWEALVAALAAAGGGKSGRIRKIQLYGKARQAPEDPVTAPLPEEYLEERASSLRAALAAITSPPPVEVYP